MVNNLKEFLIKFKLAEVINKPPYIQLHYYNLINLDYIFKDFVNFKDYYYSIPFLGMKVFRNVY